MELARALARHLLRGALAWSAITSAPAQSVLQSWTAPNWVNYSNVAVLGDIDGDGASDVAVVDWLFVRLLSGRTGQLIGVVAPPPTASSIGIWLGAVGDVDQDGGADLIFSAVENQTTLIFLIASGRSGAILWTFRNYDRAAAAGDVDGDGVPDFLLSDTQATVGGIVLAGRCDVVSGRTGAVINSFAGRATCDQLRGIGSAGDLDGDGTPDLLTESVVSCWSPGFFLHNGIWAYSGRSGQQLFYLPPASSTFGFHATGIGDFNGDGFDDIALIDYGPIQTGLYTELSVYGGPAGGLLFRSRYDRTSPGPLWFHGFLNAAGDLDADGHADLGVGGGNAINQGASIVSGRDQSFLMEVSTPGITLGPMVGDVNGDGVPDLLSVLGGPTQTLIRIYSGIAPGITMLGSGCPDSLGVVPVLGVGIGPRLGRTMTINLSQAAANATAAMLAVGGSNTNWNGVPLPLDLTPLGMPGCQWQVSGDQLLMVPTHGPIAGRQHTTWSFPVPNDPRLLGISLYSQWLVFEATTSGLSGSVSRSVRATVVL